METSAPAEVITVVIDNLSPEVAEQLPLKLVIEKGLRMVESKYMTTAIFEKTLSVPSPDKLMITDAVAEYEDSMRVSIFLRPRQSILLQHNSPFHLILQLSLLLRKPTAAFILTDHS